MPGVVVALKGLKVAERMDLGFYIEDLIAGIFDVQKCVMSKGWEKTTLFPSLSSDSELAIMLVTRGTCTISNGGNGGAEDFGPAARADFHANTSV